MNNLNNYDIGYNDATKKHIDEISSLISDCDETINTLLKGNDYWIIPFVNGIKSIKKNLIKYKESLTINLK